MVSEASTKAEREQGAVLVRQVKAHYPVRTVGGDKAYNEQDFVAALRALDVEPHLPAYDANRRDWVPAGVRETAGYPSSQRRCKWVERCFGWLKQVGGLDDHFCDRRL